MNRKINLEDILQQVPEYKEFYTVEELDKRTLELVKKYPECVSVTELGKSRQGRSIYCLKIGSGSKKAVLYGAPHPNEPVGTLMLDALSQILAENKYFRDAMDFTWYIVKASDVDGLCLNEGWFKGNFTISDYQHNFFRPAFPQQVEWSFPVDYKTYHFHEPTPETKCLMNLIDEVKPDFIYSLHNSGFGGCYWYISGATDEFYETIQKIPKKYGVPLRLGEAEMPYCKRLSDAVFEMVGMKDQYDYIEKYAGNAPVASMISGGGCSLDYAQQKGMKHTRFLVSEVPYYVNPKVADMSLTEHSYLEAVLTGSKRALDDFKFCSCICKQMEGKMKTDNPFYLAAYEQCSIEDRFDAKCKQAVATINPATKATVSQLFDLHFSHRFYSNLCIVLMRRACEWELSNGEHSETEKKMVKDAKENLYARECENLRFMESEISYTTIPIQHLVKIQLESGLLYAMFIHEN